MYIGIDLGGTKTEIICLDHSLQTLYRQRVPSPQHDYQATIKTIVELIQQAESSLNQKGTIGIGIPGNISRRDQRVKNSNSTWINGRPFFQDLQRALARELRMENDANCFALSETVDGAAQGSTSVFGVIIGTGCGGGWVLNGKIVTGFNGLGGEWGHNPLPFAKVLNTHAETMTEFFDNSGQQPQSEIYSHKQTPKYFTKQPQYSEYPGPLCYCGKRGCLETWLSGPGFADDYRRITGEVLSAKTIANLAESGNLAAQAAVERYCQRLAKSLAQIINIVDPEVIVLGGGMSNVQNIYIQVPLYWDQYTFSDHITTQLLAPKYGDSSGVRGAALLGVVDEYHQKNQAG